MDDALQVLRQEFEAADGTFMLGLRGAGLEWNRAAFSRFERAMREVCQLYQEREMFERWLAEGFYYASTFVRDWTTHPNFPKPEPPEYHEACLTRVQDLADWFFHGWHNYQEPHVWADL